jgi:Protein of unknown function (DUF1572)
MPTEFSTSYLKDSTDLLRYYKKLGERAIAQAPDAALVATLDPESNSIATIVKHISGNMRSRWTDFLTTDGEKPDRHRDAEFETPPQTRAEIVAQWEAGWQILFESFGQLTDADLTRSVLIRNESHSVIQAIGRALAHYAYHVGQIVYLAKHFASEKWTSLSVPKNKSEELNARLGLRSATNPGSGPNPGQGQRR